MLQDSTTYVHKVPLQALIKPLENNLCSSEHVFLPEKNSPSYLALALMQLHTFAFM